MNILPADTFVWWAAVLVLGTVWGWWVRGNDRD